MGIRATYLGDNTQTGPSPRVWGDCPVLDMLIEPRVGKYFYDDFLNPSLMDADQSEQDYDTYIDTGVLGAADTGVAAVDGILEVSGNDADNDEFVMSTFSPAFMVSTTAGEQKKLWFEARFKKASVADNGLAFFLGLGHDFGNGATVAKTLCLTDNDGALGAFSFLGFHVDHADGDAIDFVYRADGQAATVAAAGVQAMSADTYYKLGFKYDPCAPASERIAIYVDGVEQSTYITQTQIEAATFPDREPMALVLCTKVGAAAEVLSHLDWWRCAQLR